MTLPEFNALDSESCRSQLMTICHSSSWADRMLQGRPYSTVEEVFEAAEESWQQVSEEDILESFRGHARIGDLSALRDKYSAASAEQGQVAEAQEEVLKDLMRLNREYEAKNGFIFIVCATGKSAREMLDLLKDRMGNDPAQELKNGAAEQAKITELRLNKLFAPDQ